MNEKTRQRIVFACLGLAIVWGTLNFGKSKKPISVPEPKTIKALEASTTTRTAQALIDVEQYEKEAWGKDPFRHYRKKKEITPVTLSWNLSGIVYSPDNQIAVINNKTVRVGDRVDQARVIQIKKDQVLIEHHGSPVTLTVTKG